MKEENSTELQKPNVEAEVCDKNVTKEREKGKKKKAQKLNWISFCQ